MCIIYVLTHHDCGHVYEPIGFLKEIYTSCEAQQYINRRDIPNNHPIHKVPKSVGAFCRPCEARQGQIYHEPDWYTLNTTATPITLIEYADALASSWPGSNYALIRPTLPRPDLQAQHGTFPGLIDATHAPQSFAGCSEARGEALGYLPTLNLVSPPLSGTITALNLARQVPQGHSLQQGFALLDTHYWNQAPSIDSLINPENPESPSNDSATPRPYASQSASSTYYGPGLHSDVAQPLRFAQTEVEFFDAATHQQEGWSSFHSKWTFDQE